MSTTLYRAFDAEGNLLYIGISSQVITRFDQHTKSSKWMGDCATIKVEHFLLRNDALRAEKEAIKTENPLFNEVHKKVVAE